MVGKVVYTNGGGGAGRGGGYFMSMCLSIRFPIPAKEKLLFPQFSNVYFLFGGGELRAAYGKYI
jgi:hypothetical protein